MKRIALFCILLCLGLGLCGCQQLQQALAPQLQEAGTVEVVTLRQPAEFAVLQPERLKDRENYHHQQAEDAAEQYILLEAAARQPDTAVLVAELDTAGYAPALIELAKENDLPLLLCGACPSEQALTSYENCWYIGFDPQLAAERQAEVLLEAHAAGLIQDQNGDFKQSALCVASFFGQQRQKDGYAARLLHQIELGGVHVEATAPTVYGADAAQLTAKLQELLLPGSHSWEQMVIEGSEEELRTYSEQLAPDAQTELFFCLDTEATQAVLETVSALEAATGDPALADYATPARQYSAVGFGSNAAITAALQDGTLLGTVSYDTAAATDAVLALCENLLQGESPIHDTGLHLQDGHCLLLDYQVTCADFAAVAATRAAGQPSGENTDATDEADEGENAAPQE